jgi:3-hydroxyisobutyrate dehydrogenase-like beta-hydroxyacid dehydrogenase
MNSTAPKITIGILYCGDLGAALGGLLRKHHYRVVTTCAKRSPATLHRARLAGVELINSFSEVVGQSDLVISLVDPVAAISVAEEFARLSAAETEGCLFVDGNSLGLREVERINHVFAEARLKWCDAAFHGGARRLSEIGVMYLCGETAVRIEKLFNGLIKTRILPGELGMASSLKQTLAGFSKGLSGLFVESSLVARDQGVLDAFMEEFRNFYPEIYPVLERMLPTYREHVGRRITELKNIELSARENRSGYQMIHAARLLFEEYGADLTSNPAEKPTGERPDLLELIKCLHPSKDGKRKKQ